MGRSQAMAERFPGPRTAPSRPLPLFVERVLAVPVTLPCLGALVVFTWWAASEGGYPPTVWYPGGLLLLGLLTAAVAGLRGRIARIPAPVRLAIALFAAYTAWSYLSILWADANADAWDGANRTLVYL